MRFLLLALCLSASSAWASFSFQPAGAPDDAVYYNVSVMGPASQYLAGTANHVMGTPWSTSASSSSVAWVQFSIYRVGGGCIASVNIYRGNANWDGQALAYDFTAGLAVVGVVGTPVDPFVSLDGSPVPSTATAITVPGLVDSGSREYLSDIRQLLCWVIGLGLVFLTRQVFHWI